MFSFCFYKESDNPLSNKWCCVTCKKILKKYSKGNWARLSYPKGSKTCIANRNLIYIYFPLFYPFPWYPSDITLMLLDGQSSRVSEQVQRDFQQWQIEAWTIIDLIDNIPQSFPISPNITTITHFFLSPTFRVRKQSFPMPLSFLRTEQDCYIFSSPFRNTWLEFVQLIL